MLSNAETCPHCNVNLQGAPIPEKTRHLYGATHFSRKVSVYSRELDRTTHYRCPDCWARWER